MIRYDGFIENAGEFILEDLRKFLGLNERLAHVWLGQKCQEINKRPGVIIQLNMVRTYIRTCDIVCVYTFTCIVDYGINTYARKNDLKVEGVWG